MKSICEIKSLIPVTPFASLLSWAISWDGGRSSEWYKYFLALILLSVKKTSTIPGQDHSSIILLWLTTDDFTCQGENPTKNGLLPSQ